MFRILQVQHGQELTALGHGNNIDGVRPCTEANPLVRKSLKLQGLVGAPFQSLVLTAVVAFLQPAKGRFDDVRYDDDDASETEDEVKAEKAEGDVCSAEDFLIDVS